VPRENLAALRRLVAELEATEREELETPQETSLLDAVFSRMPIPVTIWVASRAGLCVSRRVTGAVTAAWSGEASFGAPIESAYSCPVLRQKLAERLAAASSGVEQSFLCGDPDLGTCVWTHLIPEPDGVMGISLDLSAGIGDLDSLRESDRPAGGGDKNPQEATDVE
jgi:hypothetical protein